MINYDYITKENIKNRNLNLLQLFNSPYRTIIIGGSGSGKTDALDKTKKNDDNYIIKIIYLYVNDPNEAKYQYLIKI